MIFRKDSELYRIKEQLLYEKYDDNHSNIFKEVELLSDFHERQRWMIIGEGATFLILIVLGIWKLRDIVKKEVGLVGLERNFLLSITHELKSPLSSAKLNLQTLSTRNLSSEQQKMLIHNTEEDVARLNDLVEKILLASRIGHANYGAQQDEINMSDLMLACIENVKNRNADIIIQQDIEDEIWVNGDELMLQSMVLNLIENAVKYAPTNSPIVVTFKKKDSLAILDVADDGVRIPDEEKLKIFDRFYRVGNESKRTTIGVGLGLFIVQQVALMHHGNVKIIDKSKIGKIFRVEIPYIGAL
ncbi:MAG: HAMP domain-containing histidine kinase [Chitinophagales bacterium]|nr:HAMP domain-containing histidine kinase [Chitinophagales bacterium]